MAFKKLNIYDLLCFFGGLVFFAPVSLLVRTQAGVSESAFFLLQALLSCVIFLGEVPAGFITDRIGYKNSLVVSQVLLLLARVLLLLAYLKHLMALFIAEAVVEAVSACFASGTGSAYLYEVCDKDEYTARSARCANFGTVGFIVSTIAYAALLRAFGITGLLTATVLAGAVSAFLSFFLKREPKRAEAAQKPQKPALRRSLRILTQKRAVFFIALSSIFSVAGILITFFYAEKLQACGVSAEWLSPIILVYSAVEMLAAPILGRLRSVPKRTVTALFCGLAGIAMLLFGQLENLVPVLALMILLPLLLDIPAYCIGEQENRLIDELQIGENRAASLSVLNMGVSAVEIAALFASALLSHVGAELCFLAVGTALIACVVCILLSDLGRRKKHN